jgi:hypothetical protein
MTLVLCSAIVAALVRHPDTRTVLIETAAGSLMFVVSGSVIAFCIWCIHLIIRLLSPDPVPEVVVEARLRHQQPFLTDRELKN